MSDGTSAPQLSPIFIVAPPRSGARLLFEVLSQAPVLLSPDGNAPDAVDQLPGLHPASRDWSSGRLGASDAIPEPTQRLAQRLAARVRDRDDRQPQPDSASFQVLDSSPLHALRVPFLAAAFPDARFVFGYREPAAAVASTAEAWRSPRFTSYPKLPGWSGPPWTFGLIEGWQDLTDRPVEEIAARQWRATVQTLLDDLDALPAERWTDASFERLIRDPQAEVERLCGRLDLQWDRQLTAPLPLSPATLSPPQPGKWRRRDEVQRVLPLVSDVAGEVRGRFGEGAVATASTKPLVPAGTFTSSSTESFGELLRQASSSLLISTYQSGRLILARADSEELNTHFRLMPSPMGVAVRHDEFAVGTRRRVTRYRNHDALAPKLAPKGRYDGCYLPLNSHVTGDIRVHEMAFLGTELWAVSTRFSCLVSIEAESSFRPRWKPPFVSALTPEDRCHLNGCAVADGHIRYVSALGVTDTPGGWRDNKASGGVILDVPSGEVVVAGLAMPHSPRWYDGRLWVLESGKGTLAVADLTSGKAETVATLPGFTRGLAFVGPYALVGLSQVRESIFRGLPVAQQQHRECGVWVVDTRTGEVAGFLRFDGIVQEIFDVQVLPGLRWPEIGESETDLSDDAFILPD